MSDNEHKTTDDRAASEISPNPPGVTLRPFTEAEAAALDRASQTTEGWVPIQGWRTVRQADATDLLDGGGKRVAWITSTGEVWVERPLSAGMLASVAEWAARNGR